MVFCFVQKNISGQHELEYYFFFQISTLGYMTKTESDYFFFSSTKTEYFFSATLGIRIFFQKKTITPLQVKWSFPQGYRFFSFCHFSIGFWKCSDSVVLFVFFSFILLPKITMTNITVYSPLPRTNKKTIRRRYDKNASNEHIKT